MSYLLRLLTQNPAQQFFNLTVIEYPFSLYPQGVPRSAVLTEFQSKADINNSSNGGKDIDTQCYGLANLPSNVNVPPSPLPVTKESQVS
jgi:hypothetical protein